MMPEWPRLATTLAEAHALSFYDASWAATGSELGMPLVSADQRGRLRYAGVNGQFASGVRGRST
jgi:hypothetical protein